MVVSGLVKFGWLNRLVAVTRNCNLPFSLIVKYLNSPKSMAFTPGPTMVLLAAVPNRPTSTGVELAQTGSLAGQPGTANDPTLNQPFTVGLASFHLPIASGRVYQLR